MEGYIGEIRAFAGNFAPRNWAYCNGSLQAISSNSALFSILGTIYGGDGRTTFQLPDLRGRVPVGIGTGPGLFTWTNGKYRGSEYNQITLANLPNHSHSASLASAAVGGSVPVLADEATSSNPTNAYLSSGKSVSGGEVKNFSTDTPDVSMSPFPVSVQGNVQILPSGASQGEYNIMPTLTSNYIICMYGIYPSRS